jgi:hypothetical protein
MKTVVRGHCPAFCVPARRLCCYSVAFEMIVLFCFRVHTLQLPLTGQIFVHQQKMH